MGASRLARGSADYLALSALANDLLAGSNAGRLGAATASPFRGELVSLRETGLWSLSASMPPESVGVAVALGRAALRSLAHDPLPESELAGARRRAQLVFPLQFETLGARIGQCVAEMFQGLGPEYFERVPATRRARTARRRAAAGAWWDPDRLTIVVAVPAALLRPQLAALGTVDRDAEHDGAGNAPQLSRKPRTRNNGRRGGSSSASAWSRTADWTG
jgi:predicted Zn-dependent peptidase